MNRITPRSAGGSLIERAAEAYGLDGFNLTPPPRVLAEPPAAFAETRVHAAPPTVVPSDPIPRPPSRGSASSPPLPFSGTPDQVLGDEAVARSPVAAIDRAMLAEAGMIVPGGSVGVLAEEFRLVKRQLLLTARKLSDPAKARTIAICSARPDEGKTFCAINLGISLAAERDTRVLLVDGDFAKRDLLPRLGLDNGRGFLDALGDDRLDPEALVVPTDIPQLSLLGAGTRTNGDTELLASGRTSAVVARLLAADPQRIVLFDTPPALAASPAAVFALHAGQVMLVIRADVTGESEIREAVALLDGCENIQLVLNQVRHQASGYRFGDYYAPEDVR